jgi:VanZ family protein
MGDISHQRHAGVEHGFSQASSVRIDSIESQPKPSPRLAGHRSRRLTHFCGSLKLAVYIAHCTTAQRRANERRYIRRRFNADRP